VILEVHPFGDYTIATRIMLHASPNEWQHLYCVHGLKFKDFYLTQHEGTRFIVRSTRPTARPITIDEVYHTLRREFERAKLRWQRLDTADLTKLPRSATPHPGSAKKMRKAWRGALSTVTNS
jgi:hypothetical protein